MGLDFDVREFCAALRATKPPYECPFKECGKIYKSFAGIQCHLFNYNHDDPGSSMPPGSQSPQQALTYAEAQKMVELEMEGKSQRINIYDPIVFMSKEDFEASEGTAKNRTEESQAPETTTKSASGKASTSKGANKKASKTKEKESQPPRIKEEKASSPCKLPEASYSILEAWNLPDAPERPKSYYRFIEKTPEELEDEVEYDMDEDDFTWLEFVNKQRKFENLVEVHPESFEMLMDRLEKECYFQMQSSGRDQGPPIDEDAVCCICMDGECQNSNVILFCDMCNLAVHQECYGVPYIPEGQWLCRRCLQSPSRAVDCALCPNRGGAFKQTDDGRWAHVVCALWIPEVCFANTVFLEPIDSIQNIPAARWKLTCYICKQRGAGACIQCHRANCYTAFHVTCAQQAGLHMKIDAVKDSPTSGPSVSVRKTAYCDTHTPPDSDSKPLVGDSSLGETIRKAQSKAAFREKMRKARKILAEKRSAAPIVSIPTIPPERVQEIAESIQIPGKNRFIQRLIAYWTLKRQSRNGVPLLRRLQTTHPSRRPPSVPPPDSAGGQSQVDDILFQLRYFQRLRQDLERARLLCELIRKREKTKRELMKVQERELELRLYPLQYLMRGLLQALREKDTNEIFAEPVDVDEVPDYLDFIKTPMDFSTMGRKLEALQYPSLDAFEKDFNLMIGNCMVYNAQHTMYYKAAVKLKEQAQPAFQQIRRDLETLYAGRDPVDEQHQRPDSPRQPVASSSSSASSTSSSSSSSTSTSSSSTSSLTPMEDIDRYLADKRRESESLEQQLSKLEEYLRKAQALPQGTAKAKRVRLLRIELAKVRRRLSLQAGGRAAATRSTSPSKPAAAAGRKEAESSERSSSESSSGDSDSESSDSDSSVPATPLPRGRPKATAAATPRSAARQLKIDSFITRTSKGTDGSDNSEPKTPTAASSSSKSRLVAKVLKRNREPSAPAAANSAACKQSQQQQQLQHKQQMDSDLECNARASLALPATPVKSTAGQSNPNLTGSPSGVNRRTAVLFTKKAAAAFKKPEGGGSTFAAGNGGGGSGNSSPPRRSVGRPRKTSESSAAGAAALANSGGALNAANSTNLFVAAAPAASTSNDSGRQRQKKQKSAAAAAADQDKLFGGTLLPSSGALGALSESAASLPNTESFKVYRSRPSGVDDEDSNRGSGSSCSDNSSSESGSGSDSGSGSSSGSTSSSSNNSSSNESSEESDADASSDESRTSSPRPLRGKASAGAAAHYLPLPCSEIPLQPLDLVWAKCRGFPWYPALIVDPAWPRSGYVHNGVPIAIPPEDVLAMGPGVQQPAFLVLFFDAKRTWQWLPRNKLEPLGVDPDRDKAKLIESKKQTERRAVKKAFEEAILHQCRVAGQSAALSEDSSSSHST